MRLWHWWKVLVVTRGSASVCGSSARHGTPRRRSSPGHPPYTYTDPVYDPHPHNQSWHKPVTKYTCICSFTGSINLHNEILLFWLLLKKIVHTLSLQYVSHCASVKQRPLWVRVWPSVHRPYTCFTQSCSLPSIVTKPAAHGQRLSDA